MNPRDNLELLQNIARELIAATRELIASGEEIDEELQQRTDRILVLLMSRIQELSAQGSPADGLPPGGQAPTPQLEQGPYPSSNVNSFKYDPTTEKLYVKFHGSDSADSGPTYLYQGVPRNIYDVFSKGRVAPKTSGQNQYHRWIRGVTPSLGASLYALIRQGGFPYQRVSG